MLKQLIVSAITISSVLSPTVALADHEPTTSNTSSQETEEHEVQPKRLNIKSNILEKKQEIKSSIEEKRQEIKADIEEKKEEIRLQFQQKRTEVAKQIIERQTKHADHLNNVLTRIQTKLTELESAGKDISSAQAELTKAQNSLAEVLINITTSTDILSGIDKDNITTEFPKLKESIRSTHQKLVETQKNLRSAINEAKKISEPTQKDDTEKSKNQ